MSESEATGERQTPRDQAALDRAQAHYVSELRAGHQPNVDQYVQWLPEFERELLEFAFYVESVDASLPEFDAMPAGQLTRPAQRVLDGLARSIAPGSVPASHDGQAKQRRRGRSSAGTPTSLAAAGRSVGVEPQALAEAVGVSPDVLHMLDAGAIILESVPAVLIERLAHSLGQPRRSVAAYLRDGQAMQVRKVAEAPARYGGGPSTALRVSFMEAIARSALSDERKREWAALATGGADEDSSGTSA